MLFVNPQRVRAQQGDSNPTWAVVEVLLSTRQKANEETVRRQAMATLERMGAPAAQPLARVISEEFRQAVKERQSNNLAEEHKHMDTVLAAATILGRLGNVVARDEYVIDTLLAYTYETKKIAGVEQVVPMQVRETAIEALGKIFAQKAVFLVLQSPNELTKEKNKEAQTAVETLRNESQDLKRRIGPLVDAYAAMALEPATTNADSKALEKQAKVESRKAAADLLFAARNLTRKFKLYQKLGFIMSELEPPTGKDKDLATRITLILEEIQTNLQHVWAAVPARADKTAVTQEAGSKTGGPQEAIAQAELKSHELCEEMDDLANRLDGWLQLNDRTRRVILTLHDVLRFADKNPPALVVCTTEALGRIYGNRN
jgi:hypothetical protein